MIPKRKRILFLVPAFAGGVGGAERVISTLLRYVDHSRFDCHFAMVLNGDAYIQDLPAEVTLHRLCVGRIRYALPRIIQLIWKLRPQTVLSTVAYLNVMLLLARPFLPRGVRLLLREATTPSAFIAGDTEHPRLWTWFYRRLYPHADKIICLSDSMQKDLVEHFFAPPAKVVRIYNPVDAEMIAYMAAAAANPFTAPGPNLVAAGRLRKEKGMDLLLDALPAILQRVPGAHLTILGEGPLEARLKKQAVSLGIDSAVSFMGFQANPWLYLKHADVFVLPSRYEGLPNAVLEALALGTPVVATDCPGGIREIQRSAPQIVLVPPENTGALTDAIVSILSQQKENGKPSQAEEWLRRFNPKQIADEYSRLF
ncbi:MAG TPA: glycosyltransferase [Candidatus Angelobacter sp.]|nr:glycosyltransferase [Candidatus Angelobacter sp.]